MGIQNDKNVSLSLASSDPLGLAINTTASEVALALGLVRVLTLLPIYDGTLDEVEAHLAAGWESLLQLRRLLEEAVETRESV